MKFRDYIEERVTGAGFGPGGAPKRGSTNKSSKIVSRYCHQCGKTRKFQEDQFGYECMSCGGVEMKDKI
jgi:hypothetical protein